MHRSLKVPANTMLSSPLRRPRSCSCSTKTRAPRPQSRPGHKRGGTREPLHRGAASQTQPLKALANFFFFVRGTAGVATVHISKMQVQCRQRLSPCLTEASASECRESLQGRLPVGSPGRKHATESECRKSRASLPEAADDCRTSRKDRASLSEAAVSPGASQRCTRLCQRLRATTRPQCGRLLQLASERSRLPVGSSRIARKVNGAPPGSVNGCA